MGSHFVHINVNKWDPINVVLSWPEDGRSRPNHVAKYNPTLITASCLDVCCVLTVHNILYKFDHAQRDGLPKKNAFAQAPRL